VEGKVVVVTGGGRGIGLMIATGFVVNGATVLIASRNQKNVQSTAEKLNKMGPGKCEAFVADLSNVNECKRLAADIKKKYEYINVLVNNAGATWGAPLDEYPESGWDRVMNLNLKGVFFFTQQCLPLLEKGVEKTNTHSSVINIGSVDGIHIPVHTAFAYSPSKAGLHQLSKHLASNLASKNITVNSIAAGFFPSKMTEGMIKAIGSDNGVNTTIPMNRIGNQQDISAACIFLAAKGGEWVTGGVIPIEGGTLIRAKM